MGDGSGFDLRHVEMKLALVIDDSLEKRALECDIRRRHRCTASYKLTPAHASRRRNTRCFVENRGCAQQSGDCVGRSPMTAMPGREEGAHGRSRSRHSPDWQPGRRRWPEAHLTAAPPSTKTALKVCSVRNGGGEILQSLMKCRDRRPAIDCFGVNLLEKSKMTDVIEAKPRRNMSLSSK